MERWTFLSILEKWTWQSKWTCYLLHKCYLCIFSWRISTKNSLSSYGTSLEPHHTSHYTLHTTPPTPSLLPSLPTLLLSPTKMMSASKASNNKISKYEEGHMPDFEALARDIQNWAYHHVGMATTEARLFREFLEQVCLLSRKHESCLKGTPSSQRVATQSICSGPYTSSRCSPSRAQGVPPLAHLPGPWTQRPTANGSGRSSTPKPILLTSW